MRRFGGQELMSMVKTYLTLLKDFDLGLKQMFERAQQDTARSTARLP